MIKDSAAMMQELLEHEEWVQSLARSLVRDQAAAEDLVQETWLAALRHPPANDRPLRPWLGRVVRNFANAHRRRESWRSTGMDAVLDLHPIAPEGSEAEAAEVRARIVEALLALREPYRTTVMLHYYGGLELREIARRQGLPSATVRTRLRRGLIELRGKLEGGWTDSDATFLRGLLFLAHGSSLPEPLAPLAPGAGGASAAAPTANLGLRLLAGFALAGGVTAVVVWGVQPPQAEVAAALDRAPRARPAADPALDVVAPPAGRALPLLERRATEPSSTAAAAPEPSAEQIDELAIGTAAGVVAGIVLDGFDPVHNADVVLLLGERMRLDVPTDAWPESAPRTRTDARGEFHFSAVESGRHTLALRALGQVRQRTVIVPREGKSRRTVWVFGKGSLSGVLYDQDGNALADERVRVQWADTLGPAGFQCWGQSDALGRYTVVDLPAGDYMALTRSNPVIDEDWHNDQRQLFTLEPGGALRIDFGTPAPQPTVRLRVRNRRGDLPSEPGMLWVVHAETGLERTLQCDEQGEVRDRLVAGRYTDVCWTPPGGRKQDRIPLDDFELPAEGPKGALIELVISGVRVWGAAGGRGRVYAQLIEGESADKRARSTRVAPDGSYAFDGLTAGTWSVWRGGEERRRAVEVRSGETAVRLDL